MSLCSITYSSTRVGAFVVNKIVDLAERASAYNAVSEVTGFLCHVDGLFLQTIEGEYGEVNRIYHTRIVPSRSHQDLHLIQVDNYPERRFGRWTMGFANIAPTDRELLQRFFPSGLPTAEQLSGEAVIGFLQALSQSPDIFTLR